MADTPRGAGKRGIDSTIVIGLLAGIGELHVSTARRSSTVALVARSQGGSGASSERKAIRETLICMRMTVATALLALAACTESPAPAPQLPAAGWHEFHGSWTAAGSRRTVALGANRQATLVHLTGSLLLAGPSRPGTGFRAEVIALGDSGTGLAGRAVWTDEKGDQVFSELRGEGTAARNRIEGIFLGGTGRYAGATGGYEFSWQYVIESDDGVVQGRATGLKGHVQVGQPRGTQP